jgi:hypothetical protein
MATNYREVNATVNPRPCGPYSAIVALKRNEGLLSRPPPLPQGRLVGSSALVELKLNITQPGPITNRHSTQIVTITHRNSRIESALANLDT